MKPGWLNEQSNTSRRDDKSWMKSENNEKYAKAYRG